MELQHVNAKVMVEGSLGVQLERFIDVFHQWIRESAMPEMLIDVADYRHVPDGPGVMLIGLDGDYNLDLADGRPGLRYNRKAPHEGTNVERFRQALAATARGCTLLEAHFDNALAFSRTTFELDVNDRALAPNTADTFKACRSDLDAFCAQIGAAGAAIEHQADPRRRFGVTIATPAPIDFATL